jgi:peptide/nickel transport system ATP-binding protein
MPDGTAPAASRDIRPPRRSLGGRRAEVVRTSSESGSEPVAEVRDLHVTLTRAGRRLQVLRGVDLSIARGEILGLVGESGSGKSMLSLAMLGLLPAVSQPETEGSVRVVGVDMLSGSAEDLRSTRRRHMGAVFQDPMTSLNPTMRVGQQIAEATSDVDEALKLMELVGIPDAKLRMRSYPHELSGGLRQRVMIAMAVAGNPDLVIADEPTTALDVTVQAQVLRLLASLRDELGCAVLMITHDLGVAAQIADRVAVLYAGRLAEVGPAPAVLTRPTHPYTLGLLAARLSLTTARETTLVTMDGQAPDPGDLPSGCAYAPRCPLAKPECEQALPELLAEHREIGVGAVGPDHLRACIAPVAAVVELGSARREPGSAIGGPSESVTPAVQVRNAEKTFRIKLEHKFARASLQALRGVSLEIAEGESVALVGESGSGKSTLLRVIAGLEKPERGSVVLGEGSRPQMVFQDAGSSMTPWMSVGTLIGERLRHEPLTKVERRERIAAALDKVGLPAETMRARPRDLSGGQRQRVALARATVVPPKVLLCDEPTSALDASLAASVLNLVRALRAELGMSVLFVTHDLSIARVVADRIAVMYLGRIVEVAAADELIRAPRHPYTEALLNALPELDREISVLPGEPASAFTPPPGCAFHPRCPRALPVCADPELDVRLEALRGGESDGSTSSRHLVACINPAVP